MASMTVRAPVAVAARPVVAARPTLKARRTSLRLQRVYSAPDKSQIEAAIKEAEEACAGGDQGECATAWDTVEELSAAASHAKAKNSTQNQDGSLPDMCEEDPSADECRVYE